VWCVYINSKRSKKTAPAVPALANRQASLLRRLAASLHPDSRTLYPESGYRDWGIGKRNGVTGYGVRCLPLITDSPLPFPDSGIRLRGSVNLCDTKPAGSTHEGVSRAFFSAL